mgnify:CR=1 FL=1
MKKWIVMLAMLSLLTACAQTPEPESAELTELSAATSESAEPEETSVPVQTAEPTATPEPTATSAPPPSATPAATPAPTPAPTPEPTAAPTAEPAPAQTGMSYGAVPFDLAAGTEQWWSIDSSDSAYWAVQENINALRAAGGLAPLTMDGGLSAAADARCESFVAGGPFDHSGMTTAAKSAQPVLSARPAAYAAIGRTVLPTMPTSPTPALRAWVWPVGFAPPPRGSIPTGLSPSTKTPTCFHTQIMI